jgi:hypothetical protein
MTYSGPEPQHKMRRIIFVRSAIPVADMLPAFFHLEVVCGAACRLNMICFSDDGEQCGIIGGVPNS